jgi:type VI secretion system lysozyme-related protein
VRPKGPATGLSAGPRRIDGAAPALFERLLGEDADAGTRVLDAQALRDAVAASIGMLLTVRPPVTAAGVPAALRTVLDYGAAPDPALSPAREEDRRLLAREIREAVAAFEPRLEAPAVEIAPDPDRPGAALLRIEGGLRLGRAMEPFAFIAPLHVAEGAR